MAQPLNRALGLVVAAVCAAASASIRAQEKAEDYPVKPVRLIIASAPGGGIDIIGRIVAAKLSESWPQQVIPDNRPGSANTVGTGLVAKAPPDGYTVLVQSVGVAYAGELRKLPFDASRDLIPVVPVATQPSMLGVHMRPRLSGIGMEPMGGSDEAFAKYFHTEVTKWAKVIRQAKITAE